MKSSRAAGRGCPSLDGHRQLRLLLHLVGSLDGHRAFELSGTPCRTRAPSKSDKSRPACRKKTPSTRIRRVNTRLPRNFEPTGPAPRFGLFFASTLYRSSSRKRSSRLESGFVIKSYFIISLALILGSCSQPIDQTSATVGVAANFKTTLDVLEADFEAYSDHQIDTVIGSTGKLYAQIVCGAPFDVFLAADQVRPDRLEAEGLAVEGSRFTYAFGRLVVIGIDIPDQLRSDKVSRIAIANPELAPYGKAAEQIISGLGLSESLTSKLVQGENVGQAFAFVRTGNAQAGFVSEAQILDLPATQQKPLWHPARELYSPIAQDAVLLKQAEQLPAAIAFIDYLQSDRARDIIAKHGYDLP
jgi:molybdate transport system substrate-binding protein